MKFKTIAAATLAVVTMLGMGCLRLQRWRQRR